MIPESTIREKKNSKRKAKQAEQELLRRNERSMSYRDMPDWAKVLYHQNKAILNQLGLDE